MTRDPTRRFTGRVADYARHRPGYPEAALDHLAAAARLAPGSTIADVGAGTGILTRQLLDRGYRVLTVEPNDQMRQAAAAALGGRPGFSSFPGRAEATGIPAGAADLVTAAQAFHWFDRSTARQEFRRILRPPVRVALLWNERRKESTPFARAYEAFLLEFGTDYRQVDHSRLGDAEIHEFFGPAGATVRLFDNHQHLDLEGLRGRVLSCSYVPAPDQPNHSAMLQALQTLFETHESDGLVSLEYDTRVVLGCLHDR